MFLDADRFQLSLSCLFLFIDWRIFMKQILLPFSSMYFFCWQKKKFDSIFMFFISYYISFDKKISHYGVNQSKLGRRATAWCSSSPKYRMITTLKSYPIVTQKGRKTLLLSLHSDDTCSLNINSQELLWLSLF